MRWLIILLVCTLVISDVLHMQMSLAPGLSVKNLILYWILFSLMARMVVGGGFRFELAPLMAAFGFMVAYAIFSWVVAGFFIKYPRYDVIQSGILLKGQLIDPPLFLFATLYALRTREDVRIALKGFLLAFTFANFVTITDVVGITHLGVRVGDSGEEAGRVFGMFGHANETGGLIVCLLPAAAAVAVSSRFKLFWWGCVFVSLAVLIMTVSRGAFVAAALGTAWAMYVCRRYVPVGLMLRFATVGALVIVFGVLIASLVDPHIGSTLQTRLLGESSGAVSVDQLSSGRTEIWSAAINMMTRNPITLLTGYGWDAYSVMPFHFATHNHYLDVWFELGIPGLTALVFVLGYVIVTARRALTAPNTELRPHLVACVFGMLSLAIDLMFGNMLNPWPYIWIYTGILMRAALLTVEPATQSVAADARMEPLRTVPAPRFRGQPT
jgi:O-antigen ligase